MTIYTPLSESEFDPIKKKLILNGGHLEETVNGKVEVSEGDTTVYGEIEVKANGSYELLEDGLSFRKSTLQEKNALVDRFRKQCANAEKYNRSQDARENVLEHIFKYLPYYTIAGLATYNIIKWLN